MQVSIAMEVGSVEEAVEVLCKVRVSGLNVTEFHVYGGALTSQEQQQQLTAPAAAADGVLGPAEAAKQAETAPEVEQRVVQEAATKPKRKRRTKKEMEEARKATEVEKPEPIPAEKRRGLTAKEAFAWAVEQKQQEVIDQVLEIMGELGATKFGELTEETAPIFAARVSELRDAA